MRRVFFITVCVLTLLTACSPDPDETAPLTQPSPSELPAMPSPVIKDSLPEVSAAPSPVPSPSAEPSPTETPVTPSPDDVPAEPPVITGARDLIVFIGDKVAYKKGVTAKDSNGTELAITVVSGAVNLNAEGTYPLTYQAEDEYGNTVSVNVTVTVAELTEEAVYTIADNILAGITTEDMSLYDKAHAIYKWVTKNILYTGSAEKDDVLRGAYRGFKSKQGDCYTFYSVSEVLLVRAGMESIKVDRINGRVNHSWNLVNIGTGWYHFDTTPFVVVCATCLFTDAQAEEFSRLRTDVRNCYSYNKALYPAVATEPAAPPAKPEPSPEPSPSPSPSPEQSPQPSPSPEPSAEASPSPSVQPDETGSAEEPAEQPSAG